VDAGNAILGTVPPALVLLAEVLNPVSETAIRRQIITGSARLVVRRQGNATEDDISFDKDVENVAKLVARTAIGAVKVAMLIPTWIAVTAGLTAILMEVTPSYYISAVSAWTALWAILGIKYFSIVDYEKIANFTSTLPLLDRLRGAERLSLIIAVVNAVVIVAVLCTWWLTHNAPAHPQSGAIDSRFVWSMAANFEVN
jgi:hypothetical protein